MKKFIAIITTISLLTVIVLFSFTSCKTDTNTSKEANSTVETQAPIKESMTETPIVEQSNSFPSLPEEKRVLEEYISEVKKRKPQGEDYAFSEEEKAFYTERGIHFGNICSNEIKNGSEIFYYYPVVYISKGEIVIIYTDSDGNVESYTFEKKEGSKDYGRLHRPSDLKDFEVLSADKDREIIFRTSKVEVYQYQEVIASYEIPEGAIYCGLSEFEGFIFHLSDEVYALRGKNGGISDYCELSLERIATEVEYVVLADYPLASDPWSQPLFKMKDASLKAYVRWYGDKNDPDDVDHLVELLYEGGYSR